MNGFNVNKIRDETNGTSIPSLAIPAATVQQDTGDVMDLTIGDY